MRKMKKTFIPYIGDVPINWDESRIGSIYAIRNSKVSDKEYSPLSVTMQGIVPQLETAAKTSANDERKLVKKGDFVINSRSDRRGSCGISNYDGSVSLINLVLYPRENMNPSYYNWYFHNDMFSSEFYKWGHGIVDDLWTTTWQDMKNIKIVVPPLPEQKEIANYLDNKCNQIDEINSILEKQIETLQSYKKSLISETVTRGLNPNVKTKPSGIDWIGDIPEHWQVSKIKYTCKERSDKGLMDPDIDKYIGLENVKGWTAQYIETESQYKISVQKKCHKGDLMFGKLRPYLAKILLVPFDGYSSSEFLHLCNFAGDIRFLKYFMLNPAFIVQTNSCTYGSTMPYADPSYVKNLPLPLPPLPEQKEIANYLDNKCNQIDEINSILEKQIETLQSYKKSLISETVTRGVNP